MKYIRTTLIAVVLISAYYRICINIPIYITKCNRIAKIIVSILAGKDGIGSCGPCARNTR